MLADWLGDRRVEEERGVGGVVVSDQDDRPLGAARPELGEHLMGASLRQEATKAPLARRQLVGDQARRGRPGGGGESPREPAAASGGDPGDDAGGGQEAERPPEAAAGLGFLLYLYLSGPRLAQLVRQPLGRPQLALGSRGSLDRA